MILFFRTKEDHKDTQTRRFDVPPYDTESDDCRSRRVRSADMTPMSGPVPNNLIIRQRINR